jgi:hypothetical protein
MTAIHPSAESAIHKPFRFENGPVRFSETVGDIFFNVSLNPKLRSRTTVHRGDETSSSGFG